jgi:two-component system CheB/CheR fusion protein
VGASAGGLEAFRKLLAALPLDTGMAYVLVQHLDPRHESSLAGLLAKGSRMPVSEVKEDAAVEPNHVYVTPGQHDVSINGGTLKLIPRTSTRGQHMPIDSFLRTLAEAQGPKAIGVILSGTASDGTLGVKAIKAEGGITFAQDRASAAYDGMPRSAVASGCVDFVLPPDEIARELSRLSRHPYVISPSGQERADERTPSVLKGGDGLTAILALLRKSTGADFSAYKPPTIKRRIARRMALVHIETLEDYARYLAGHREEAQALYQDCLITVTSFFRDPEPSRPWARTFSLAC